MKKKKLTPYLFIAVVLLLAVVLGVIYTSNKGAEPQAAETVVKPTAATSAKTTGSKKPAKSAVEEPARSTERKGDKPTKLSRKIALEQNTVTLRSKSDESSFILSSDPSDEQIALIKSLGGNITPSKSGRTGQVVRIKSSAVEEVKAKLAEAGIALSGQLLEISVVTGHKHEGADIGLVENYGTISAMDGVLQVPRFLGDPKGEEIDVIIDPEKISFDDILPVLTEHRPHIHHADDTGHKHK